MPPPLSNALATLCLTAIAFAQSPCPAVGVTVDASGGRLGDIWRVDIQASPTVPGVLGLDLAPGPVPTPLGTICLGLTPGLATAAFLTDPAGTVVIVGLFPAVSAFAGIQIHTAAVTLDPAQPTGFGISNGDSFRLREPRFWYVRHGIVMPWGTTPGAIAATSAISDDLVYSLPLVAAVRAVATVPERGWLCVLQSNGLLFAVDGDSLLPVFSTWLTGAEAQATNILALPGGNELLLVSFGIFPFPFGGIPGSVHHVTLPGGAVTSFSLPAGNPDAIIRVPGTSLVYLRVQGAPGVQNGVIPFDYASMVLYPIVPLPSLGRLADWQVSGTLLYVLHAGLVMGPSVTPAAVSVIDAIGQTALATNQLAMTPPVHMLRAGPGSSGSSLYVYGWSAGLQEFQQLTVAPIATIPGVGITAMELSSLGSMWLMLSSNAPYSLLGMPVGSTGVVPLGTLSGAPHQALAVSPSAAYGKVGIVVSNNRTAPFRTDAVWAAGTSVVLPIGSVDRIIPD